MSKIDDIKAQVSGLEDLLERKPRVLVVDDDSDVVELTKTVLEMCGYEVLSEPNTNTAAENYITGKYGEVDIILADYNNKNASKDIQGGLTLLTAINASETPYIICWDVRTICSNI